MMLKKEDEKSRILYCPDKNRFGDISEKAYFEMGSRGLLEVPENPNEPLQPSAPKRLSAVAK
jgi:predicted ATP-dependent serine protease